MNKENKYNHITNRKQLCNYYEISRPTLKKWLKAAKIDLPPGYLNPKIIKEIIEKFGEA